MLKNKLLGAILLPSLMISTNASAIIDPDATVVYLRKSCIEYSGGPELNNCFVDTNDILAWLGGDGSSNLPYPTRNDDAGPLRIEIGPGRFAGFECKNKNDISLIGSGPGVTILGGPANSIGIKASHCFNFNVQDLRVESGFISVEWVGRGSSTWSNVHAMPNSLTQVPGYPTSFPEENVYGWSETGCLGIDKASRPVHRWVNSRIVTTGKTAYLANCSENWFFATQFETNGEGFLSGLRGLTVVGLDQEPANRPEVHIYGSNIRVIAAQDASFPTPHSSGDGIGIMAASVGQNGELHIHGTGIDVIGNNIPNDIAALAVADNGFIHASQSAFVMQTTAPGRKYRIKNDGGTIKAPYQWADSTSTDAIVSENGSDMVIENLCPDATLACSDNEKRPNVMVYSEACSGSAGPWFNTTRNECKQ